MSSHLILDTGPWVALLCRDDTHHAWVKTQLALQPGPLLTLDSDFLIYRRHGRKVIPLLMPVKG